MNKKILIATVFATLMLTVPMTSVVGVSDVNEDCGCQVVNSSDLFRVKLLMVRLKVVTNILLFRFGHIPKVREKCEEILEIINLPIQSRFSTDICSFLLNLMRGYWDLFWKIGDILTALVEQFPNLRPTIDFIAELLYNLISSLTMTIYVIYVLLGCEVPPPQLNIFHL